MAVDQARKVRLVRIAHVYYEYADFDKAVVFLNDFGFTEAKKVSENKIYYRGYGTDPWVLCAIKADKDKFGGVAFTVEGEEDLELARDTLPNATEIYELEDAPGKGKCVTFLDPVDGFPFHLVYGQEEVPMLEKSLHRQAVNYPTEKNRGVNEKQRFEKGPAPVHKLGHFGVCTTDFPKSFEFYLSKFNFRASDIVYNEEGVDFTVFVRLDREKEQVDHHSFFFFQGPQYRVHHTSYETFDHNTQFLGHDWLRERGYQNCWGVGRHVLGSQIFDYWFDPAGFIMEHYVDGDLANDQEPAHRSKVSPDTLHVWGPPPPPGFV